MLKTVAKLLEKVPLTSHKTKETQLKIKGYNFTLATQISHNNINVLT